MEEKAEPPRLLRVAELFQRHGVEFIVIGGQAAVLWGSPQPTLDVDLCYRRTSSNLERLASALKEIHPSLRGAPADLPFRLDARSLALGANFTFNTDLGPLDLLGWVEPFGPFEELYPRCESMEVGETRLLVISLDDLISIKQHIGRPKDQAALVQLQSIRRLRERTGEGT